jgi:MFS family permease
LDVSLFSNLPFTVGMSIGSLFFLVNAALLFAVSVFLQAGVHFDPLQTALATLPFSAILAIVSLASPGLARHVATKWIVVIGSAVMFGGIMLISQSLSITMQPMDALAGMVLAGAGAGLLMAQATGITMMTVTPEQEGAASGLSETMKEIVGQGFAVALAGAILFGAVYGSMVDSFEQTEGLALSLVEEQTIIVELEDTFQEISEDEELSWVAELPENTRIAYKEIIDVAAVKGVRAALNVAGIAVLACLLLALLLPARKLAD